ncbi:MAG: 23S rRNA (adenine(2503)-C(2))-methyltransferase RlmN, partial [candidate division NC10 bacterium]|nr:23S rRNA (adenine(2503)-C(2))-methyltransferase RlmN [candidate division NC10 bacterium]
MKTAVSLGVPQVEAPDLRDFTLPELTEWITTHGEPPYRAGQIFRWLWKRQVDGFREMTNLPMACRQLLEAQARIGTIMVGGVQSSQDGTRKLLLQLTDGEQIEAVLIPEGRRLTACISTQAGCAMECGFCLTATMGLHRNLRPAEIAGQLVALGSILSPGESMTHVVLMGMGEPLANYAATEKA